MLRLFLQKKYIRIIFLVVVLYCLMVIITVVHPTLHYGIKYLINSPNILDMGKKSFAPKFKRLIQVKLDSDLNNHLWQFNPDVKVPTSIEIKKDQIAKGKFDPRMTLSVYMRWIDQNKGKPVKFHWSDWVNMAPLDTYLDDSKPRDCKEMFKMSDHDREESKAMKIEDYCTTEETTLGFKVRQAPGCQSVANHKITGKAYLYTVFPPPSKLVFLTDQETIVVQVESERNELDQRIMHNDMTQVFSEGEKVDVMSEFKTFANFSAEIDRYRNLRGEIELRKEDFEVDPKAEIEKYEKDESKKRYVEALQGSVSEKNPPKFFNEATLIKSVPEHWRGAHYDWRFFSKLHMGEVEQSASLHRLLKSWLQLTNDNNINTWVGHGSLLAWHWNSLLFPWDTDIDVQMPIADLYKLAREFNQSLVVERVSTPEGEFDGMGRFFLDVGSTISHRTAGNGNNNIDARFIDVDTGLYIDITGLAVSDTPAPGRYIPEGSEYGDKNHVEKNRELQVYNCRNRHFVHLDHVSPLRAGVMENQVGFFPNQYEILLKNEYGLHCMTRWNFGNFYFDDNLRNWILTEEILVYMRDPVAWLAEFEDQAEALFDKKGRMKREGEEEEDEAEEAEASLDKRVVGEVERYKLKKLQLKDYLRILMDDGIFEEFMITRNFTRAHETLRSHHRIPESVLQYAKSEPVVGRRMRSDLYMDSLLRRF